MITEVRAKAIIEMLPVEVQVRIIEIAQEGAVLKHKEELFSIWDRYVRMSNNPVSRSCPKCASSVLSQIMKVVEVLTDEEA